MMRRLTRHLWIASAVMLTIALPFAGTASASGPARGETPAEVVAGIVTWKEYVPRLPEGWLGLPTGPECWSFNVIHAEYRLFRFPSADICVDEQTWKNTPLGSYYEGVPVRMRGNR